MVDSILDKDVAVVSEGNPYIAGYITNSKPLNKNIPAFARAYQNIFGNNKPILTNQDFTEDEINALRQAVFNKMFEQNNASNLDIEGRLFNLNLKRPKDKQIKNYLNNTIDYPNYDTRQDNGKFAFQLEGFPNNVNSSMASTIGTANYTIDKYGNILVHDRYNFDRPFGMANPISNIAHALGYLFGNPYNIKISLGNPKDWNKFQYTGNSLLGIRGQ